jgi:hypothetical protein
MSKVTLQREPIGDRRDRQVGRPQRRRPARLGLFRPQGSVRRPDRGRQGGPVHDRARVRGLLRRGDGRGQLPDRRRVRDVRDPELQPRVRCLYRQGVRRFRPRHRLAGPDRRCLAVGRSDRAVRRLPSADPSPDTVAPGHAAVSPASKRSGCRRSRCRFSEYSKNRSARSAYRVGDDPGSPCHRRLSSHRKPGHDDIGHLGHHVYPVKIGPGKLAIENPEMPLSAALSPSVADPMWPASAVAEPPPRSRTPVSGALARARPA